MLIVFYIIGVEVASSQALHRREEPCLPLRRLLLYPIGGNVKPNGQSLGAN